MSTPTPKKPGAKRGNPKWAKGCKSPNPGGASKATGKRPPGRRSLAQDIFDNMTEEMRLGRMEGGLMPLDYMLAVLRDPKTQPSKSRAWAAKEAAPYLHKKMPVAIEMVGGDTPQPTKITIEFKDSAKPPKKEK